MFKDTCISMTAYFFVFFSLLICNFSIFLDKALQDNDKWTQHVDKIANGLIGALVTLFAVGLANICYKRRKKKLKGNYDTV